MLKYKASPVSGKAKLRGKNDFKGEIFINEADMFQMIFELNFDGDLRLIIF